MVHPVDGSLNGDPPVGLCIHYSFDFRGSEAELLATLEQLRARFEQLSVRAVGAIERHAAAVRRDGQDAPPAHLPFEMAFLLERLEHMRPVSVAEASEVIRNIVASGTGYSLEVDVTEGCEPFVVILGHIGDEEHWSGAYSTVTQFALTFLDAHLTVIAMLDLCNDVGLIRRVLDEGGYWRTRDVGTLIKSVCDFDAHGDSDEWLAGE